MPKSSSRRPKNPKGRRTVKPARPPESLGLMDSVARAMTRRPLDLLMLAGPLLEITVPPRLQLGARPAGGPSRDELMASFIDVDSRIHIDHNMGVLVKDAFVMDEPTDVLAAQLRSAADDDPDVVITDLSLSDARARIEPAIELTAVTFPPIESDSWPLCRPLVTWLTGLLPRGGSGYVRPDWSSDDRDELVDASASSRWGREFDDPENRALLDSVLWFATDYGTGDPLRWSPVSVEILLADWFPRKVIADVEFLDQLPQLLRAFVRYAHDRQGIRAILTAQTLDAVGEHEPQYRQLIRQRKIDSIGAQLRAFGVDPGGSDDGGEPALSFADYMLTTLDRVVGRGRVLDTLDARPLPDEEFQSAGVPDDIRERVREVLDLVDRCCVELLDIECRTACRRLLSRIALGDPEIFRRKGSAKTAAAALIWIIAKANDVVGHGGEVESISELAGFFGVKGSPSTRAQTLLKATGITGFSYGASDVGSADPLVSQQRSRIIARRDGYVAQLAE